MLKRPVILALSLLVSGASLHGMGPVGPPRGYTLDWADEFDGPEIDAARWVFEVNGIGGGNNELQYYTARPENAFLTDGKLVLRALREEYTGAEGVRQYTSARLRTLGKADWKHGYFEIRANMPCGKGLWPALWLLPADDDPKKPYAEIDIAEIIGHDPGAVHGTIHSGPPGKANRRETREFRLKLGSFCGDFHVFGLEWTAKEITWSVDGHVYQKQKKWRSKKDGDPKAFDRPFYLILNVAVGGDWPGPPDASTVFPQQMEVDYVRVYQRGGESHPAHPQPTSRRPATR
ncbi:MAG: glycoside hydrolase family 16 protein [Acidobacteriales bacterium]|nr:glycoside hydrolase family 16 protein [Terriglobales bacterium]